MLSSENPIHRFSYLFMSFRCCLSLCDSLDTRYPGITQPFTPTASLTHTPSDCNNTKADWIVSQVIIKDCVCTASQFKIVSHYSLAVTYFKHYAV